MITWSQLEPSPSVHEFSFLPCLPPCELRKVKMINFHVLTVGALVISPVIVPPQQNVPGVLLLIPHVLAHTIYLLLIVPHPCQNPHPRQTPRSGRVPGVARLGSMFGMGVPNGHMLFDIS